MGGARHGLAVRLGAWAGSSGALRPEESDAGWRLPSDASASAASVESLTQSSRRAPACPTGAARRIWPQTTPPDNPAHRSDDLPAQSLPRPAGVTVAPHRQLPWQTAVPAGRGTGEAEPGCAAAKAAHSGPARGTRRTLPARRVAPARQPADHVPCAHVGLSRPRGGRQLRPIAAVAAAARRDDTGPCAVIALNRAAILRSPQCNSAGCSV